MPRFTSTIAATGVRLTFHRARLTRWLRGGVDLGVDQIEVPFSYYEMFAARGELMGGHAYAAAEHSVTPSWLGSSSTGGVIAAALDVSPSFCARVELEASGIVPADTVRLAGTPMPGITVGDGSQMGYAQRAFSSSVVLSVGLSIR